MSHEDHKDWCVAICERFSVLAMAAVSPNAIIEVRRRFLRHAPKGQRSTTWAAQAVAKLAADYGIAPNRVNTFDVGPYKCFNSKWLHRTRNIVSLRADP